MVGGNKVFLALCEPYYIIHSNPSEWFLSGPWGVSCHAHPSSAEDSRGALCRAQPSVQCSPRWCSALKSPVSQASSCSQLYLLNSGRPLPFFRVSLHCAWPGDPLQAVSQGDRRANFFWFSSFKDHCSLLLHVQCLEYRCLIYFIYIFYQCQA